MFDYYFIRVSSCNGIIVDNKEVSADICKAKYNFICNDQVSVQMAQFIKPTSSRRLCNGRQVSFPIPYHIM